MYGIQRDIAELRAALESGVHDLEAGIHALDKIEQALRPLLGEQGSERQTAYNGFPDPLKDEFRGLNVGMAIFRYMSRNRMEAMPAEDLIPVLKAGGCMSIIRTAERQRTNPKSAPLRNVA